MSSISADQIVNLIELATILDVVIDFEITKQIDSTITPNVLARADKVIK